ncbi:unnamed protein product, partial [Prorocentrum cordatum]
MDRNVNTKLKKMQKDLSAVDKRADTAVEASQRLRLWMKKHQSMEQRQMTSTLVNLAIVLSQAEGKGRRFKIVFPQREIRLPDEMGQRKQVAYISAIGTPTLTLANFNDELKQADLKDDETFQHNVEQSKQDFQ